MTYAFIPQIFEGLQAGHCGEAYIPWWGGQWRETINKYCWPSTSAGVKSMDLTNHGLKIFEGKTLEFPKAIHELGTCWQLFT